MKNRKTNPSIDSEEANQSEAEAENNEETEEVENKKEKAVAPKLEEGFFEIEAIRKKRVRKGDLQYLIKWRGWPESANTWEPINNLQACSDFIDAFEERMQTGKRKRRGPYSNVSPYSFLKKNPQGFPSEPCLEIPNNEETLEKNAQRFPSVPCDEIPNNEETLKKDTQGLPSEPCHESPINETLEKNTEGFPSEPCQETPNNEETKSGNNILGDEAGSKDCEGANGIPPKEVESDKKMKEGQEDCLNEDMSSKILQGAKRRKSGSVKRFKPDVVVDSVEGDNCDKSKVDNSVKLPYIVKLLKPVEYRASVTGNEQQVSIKFKALRSDGQEVLVDDKELKANNPLVLISYYEQHLRYNPPICDDK